MKDLIKFLKDFISNKGLYVLSSLFISKIALFVSQIIVIRLLSKETFGSIVYFISIVAFFYPIVGGGTYQGLLRFGSILDEEKEKNDIAAYSFQKGFKYQHFITILFVITCYILTPNTPDFLLIVFLLSLRLYGTFLVNILQSHYRAINQNIIFSKINIIYNVFGLVITVLFTVLWGLTGYFISLATSALVVLVYFNKSIFLIKKPKFNSISKKEYWWFNFYASFALLISEFAFILDIQFANTYLSPSEIADYKTLILLPFNLWILPLIFIQTDFPKLSYHYKDKIFIKNYIFNYTKTFLFIGAIILFVSYVFKDELIPFVFGNKYHGGIAFFWLVATVVFSWFTKTIYTNLLAAIGKIKYNIFSGLLSVIVLSVSAYFLIPIYKVDGLVISTCLSIISSGLYSIFVFYYIYPKVTKHEEN